MFGNPKEDTMALTFNLTKLLTDGNQLRVTQGAVDGTIDLSVKIGINPMQTVNLTQSEANTIRQLLSILVVSKSLEPS